MKHLSSFLKSIILFLLSFLFFLSLISYTPLDISFLSFPVHKEVSNLIGITGAYLGLCFFFIFGYASYFFPFYFFFLALDKLGVLRFYGLGKSKPVKLIAFIFFTVFFSVFIGLFFQEKAEIFNHSGLLGFFLAVFFKKYLGTYGSFITIFLLMSVSSILLFGLFFIDCFKGICSIGVWMAGVIKNIKLPRRNDYQKESKRLQAKPKRFLMRKQKKPEDIKPEIKVYTPSISSKEKSGNIDFERKGNSIYGNEIKTEKRSVVKAKTGNVEVKAGKEFDPEKYKVPSQDILKVQFFPGQETAKENIKESIKSLEIALSDFGVEAKVVSVQKGPVVTMYELQPQPGTKIQRISSLSDDIALAMKSSLIRIVAPIPGRGTIGVEIPNAKKNFVFLREVLEEKTFKNSLSKLTLAIGKDVSGNPIVADLGEMPHLLIAGATGAGKTVCVNSLISSILFKAKPSEVKFILIDPKMVELAAFSGIPHLIHPIISEAKKAFVALNWAVEEMGRRYKLLAEEGCRNIAAYNKGSRNLPYIVIVVDELADLMIVARESIETAIQRLAQLSRAVGIHLILATQRPSVDVITGVIKANFPARISFKVASKVDSRTVLDMMGADKLLGKGDLLFLKPGAVKLIRAQGTYIEDEDIENLTNFIRAQGNPVYEESISEGEKNAHGNLGEDELFEDAVKIVLRTRQASGSILQRRMRVGYTRAARLLDLMEQASIVGPFCGSKAREILVDPDKFLAEKGWI